jgi:AmmeMemoRadiSam system protein A
MNEFCAEYSEEERRWLLRLARESIGAAVCHKTRKPTDGLKGQATAHLREARGAFVTLHKEGELRGCVGIVMAVQPLDATVWEMARAAAVEDTRFSPVTEAEVDSLELEISVLSPMFEIAPEEVVVGRHGLMVSYGNHRGLLLPQVAPEWGWDRETFLAQSCRKAGLAPDSWKKGAKIEAFTAEVFGEKELGENLRD